jgi:RNA polymerase sigma-70 factor (ECF subfamily)
VLCLSPDRFIRHEAASSSAKKDPSEENRLKNITTARVSSMNVEQRLRGERITLMPGSRDREATWRLSDTQERELLAACRQGDPAALRQLVDAHYEPLYRFLWRLTASSDAASELTQETFVRALLRLDSFNGRSRFSTWLHAIALNLWKDARRAGARESEILLDNASIAADAPAGEPEALASLERHEVRDAVERLPERQRLAILLFYYQGMSYKEIASLRGCPMGTVGSWIHHGVRALKRRLAPAEADPVVPNGPPRKANELGEPT